MFLTEIDRYTRILYNKYKKSFTVNHRSRKYGYWPVVLHVIMATKSS
jgi:hypothetical protein